MAQTAPRDVISLLIQDHRELDELLVRLEELADDAGDTGGRVGWDPGRGRQGEARTVTGQVIAELTGHWAAERRYLYPLVRKRVPGAAALADRDAAEQVEVEDDLRVLHSLDPAQDEFWGRVAVVTDRVRAHVRDEESELFPLVRDAVPRKVLVELAGLVGTGVLQTT